MAYTTIDNGSEYFNTVLYTGNGSTNNITGVGFQPDWVWGKCRSAAQSHRLFDSSRGTLKNLISNASNAEATTANSLTSFDSDGFTLGSDDNLNFNTRTFVAWNWLANGGTTSSNTDGSITSTVQANTTAGFNIVTYTATGSNATVGHGLGVVPKMLIIKQRTGTAQDWAVYHDSVGATKNFQLNTDAAVLTSSTPFQDTSPTTTVFSIGTNARVNQSSSNMVAYCFAEIQGYSKFGSYTGNGNADGPFVYTGFKPAWILFKNTGSTTSWRIIDNKRDTRNGAEARLFADNSDAENTSAVVLDILSNGFKIRTTNGGANTNGVEYIYMAFAEHPFVSSKGAPVTAK